MRRAVALLLVFTGLSAALVLTLGTRATGFSPLGTLLDPLDGLYRTARHADNSLPAHVELSGLQHPVHIEWDGRGVPHIFAESDLDAIRALGYVVARDRTFQIDFLPRAASGKLAEALGPGALEADRFLRRTGMDRGARRNLERIYEEDGEELAMLIAYADGVNAYLAGLQPRDLPFEFRVIGYEPAIWTPLQTLRMLQYMNYDLTYRTDDSSYSLLRQRLSAHDFELLYPQFEGLSVPIIPADDAGYTFSPDSVSPPVRKVSTTMGSVRPLRVDFSPPIRWPLLEGFVHGKGSNSWAVAPERSQTGEAILAGDMHLSLTLPSIWYEVHVVTPSMNSYGVTVPGATLPVEAFNSYVAWALTNTGSDQIDHYAVEINSSRTHYRIDDEWRELEIVRDTIRVKGEESFIDTLRYTHWGPVVAHGGRDVTFQWTAHKPSRTLAVLGDMNRAKSHTEFQRALRMWDTPMLNVLYADVEGNISIRSTGFLPIRKGGQGDRLLDGTSTESDWTGRVPFDELPNATNPRQGFLASTNQRPVDSTYAYYIGSDWRAHFRSLRIDSLLRRRTRHSVDDITEYQSDVHAVQFDLLFPILDTLSGLSQRAEQLRSALRDWDGTMAVDLEQPRILDHVLSELSRLAWDEDVFAPGYFDVDGSPQGSPLRVPIPAESRLLQLLRDRPMLKWFDVVSTSAHEDASGLLRAAMEAAGRRLDEDVAAESTRFAGGQKYEALRWGRHREVEFQHLIDSPIFRALGRGPFEFPGYRETLSPAGRPVTSHSASWRVVVDFSSGEPRGRGIYPGGQRGNPFSRFYDLHLPAYLAFENNELLKPASSGELAAAQVLSKTVFHPAQETN